MLYEFEHLTLGWLEIELAIENLACITDIQAQKCGTQSMNKLKILKSRFQEETERQSAGDLY